MDRILQNTLELQNKRYLYLFNKIILGSGANRHWVCKRSFEMAWGMQLNYAIFCQLFVSTFFLYILIEVLRCFKSVFFMPVCYLFSSLIIALKSADDIKQNAFTDFTYIKYKVHTYMLSYKRRKTFYSGSARVYSKHGLHWKYKCRCKVAHVAQSMYWKLTWIHKYYFPFNLRLRYAHCYKPPSKA